MPAFRHSGGLPYVYPDNELGFTENFLSMMFRMAEPRYGAEPALIRARAATWPAPTRTGRRRSSPRSLARTTSSRGTTDPTTRSLVLQKRAVLEAMRGDFEAAPTFYRQAKELALEYGLRLRQVF
jgi:hypothetical protein